MFEILFIIIGLSFLVIIHEAGHFFAAKFFGILVEEFGFGLPPRIFGRKFGETFISLNWLPFGGFVRVYGERHDQEKSDVPSARSFSHQSTPIRFCVMAAGVAMNFLLGWWLLSAVFMIGIPQSLIVTEIKSGSIAENLDIREGDQILGFDSIAGFTEFLKQSERSEISFRTSRSGEEKEIRTDFSNLIPENRGKLGVYLVEAGTPKMAFLPALAGGFVEAWKMSLGIVLGLFRLAAGLFTDWSVFSGFAGPVGIVNIAAQTAKLGLASFLRLLSLISLNLAVFNLLPIPALDGGRILFLIIEKIKGKKVDPKNEMIAQAMSFVALIILILGVTIQDILRLL